jgi:hypothetical protein
MVYDQSRRQVVIFGGMDLRPQPAGHGQPRLQDTWTWDGNTWSERTPVTSPPAAYGPALVYDTKLGQVVALVDVSQGTKQLTQTWTWDGTTWAKLHPTVELPGSSFTAVTAYDAVHGTVVVFGRTICTGAFECIENSDTWTFDGGSWLRHAATAHGPLGRVAAAMAEDPSSGQIVMYGGMARTGASASPFLSDTWTWDGSRWNQAHPLTSPWARTNAIATSDTNAHQVILLGGYVGEQYFGLAYSDLWAWAQGSWTLVHPTTMPAPAANRDAIVAAASVGPRLLSSCTEKSPPCMAVRGQPELGLDAAYVVFDLNPPEGANAMCVSYVSYVNQGSSDGPWHQVGVVCGPSDGQTLQLGTHAKVAVTGCANVRLYPVGPVTGCLPDGTQVTIDDGPVAVVNDSKRIWWHLQDRGWIANELLVAVGGA